MASDVGAIAQHEPMIGTSRAAVSSGIHVMGGRQTTTCTASTTTQMATTVRVMRRFPASRDMVKRRVPTPMGTVYRPVPGSKASPRVAK